MLDASASITSLLRIHRFFVGLYQQRTKVWVLFFIARGTLEKKNPDHFRLQNLHWTLENSVSVLTDMLHQVRKPQWNVHPGKSTRRERHTHSFVFHASDITTNSILPGGVWMYELERPGKRLNIRQCYTRKRYQNAVHSHFIVAVGQLLCRWSWNVKNVEGAVQSLKPHLWDFGVAQILGVFFSEGNRTIKNSKGVMMKSQLFALRAQ